MKRILITNASSRHNRGDSAILSGQIIALNKIFPNAIIRVLSLDPYGEIDHRGAIFKESIIYWALFRKSINHSFILKFARFIYILTIVPMIALLSKYLGTRILGLLPKDLQKILNEYKKADIVTAIGGGYLRTNATGIRPTLDLIALSLEILYGKIFNKPVVLFSASVGPFKSKLHEWISLKVLNLVDHTIIREKYSYNLVKGRVKQNQLSLTGDLAFLANKKYSRRSNPKRLLTGVTVRQWMSPEKQAAFETSIAKVIEKHPEIDFVFLPQVTSELFDDDDRVVARRVYDRISNNKHVKLNENDLTVTQIQKEIAKCDVFMGMRMHSNIFALGQQVPVLALAYEYKTQGIMDDFGIGKWVIPVENVTEKKLSRMFKEILPNKVRSDYRQTITDKLPEYKKHILETTRTAVLKVLRNKTSGLKIKASTISSKSS